MQHYRLRPYKTILFENLNTVSHRLDIKIEMEIKEKELFCTDDMNIEPTLVNIESIKILAIHTGDQQSS